MGQPQSTEYKSLLSEREVQTHYTPDKSKMDFVWLCHATIINAHQRFEIHEWSSSKILSIGSFYIGEGGRAPWCRACSSLLHQTRAHELTRIRSDIDPSNRATGRCGDHICFSRTWASSIRIQNCTKRTVGWVETGTNHPFLGPG